MTYYLKYRPKILDELDIEDARESLKQILSGKDIPHAFLFSGPKGTGKTSAARIVAKMQNCKNPEKNGNPCNKCNACLSISRGENIDVVELDAASNRGIDDIRNLRDAVKLAPANSKKKVYIVDEAHMLTTEASNALLKTLEEPPSHVMFILATTNPEKLIETIRSRTTNIGFRNAKKDELVRSLSRVIKNEKLNINKEIVDLIASAAKGSLRDSHKTLEQLVSEKKLKNAEEVREHLFKGGLSSVQRILEYVFEKKVRLALEETEKAISRGVSAEFLIENIQVELHMSLLAKEGIGVDEYVGVIKGGVINFIKILAKNVGELRSMVPEQLPLELSIIEWCGITSSGNGEEVDNKDEKNKSQKSREARNQSKTQKMKELGENKMVQNDDEIKPLVNDRVLSYMIGEDTWKRILMEVKPINTSIEALLRAAKPMEYDGKTLTLGVFYRFHKERLEDNQHRAILEKVVANVLGNPTRVICTLAKPPIKKEESTNEVVSSKIDEQVKTEDVVLTEGDDEDIINIAKEIFG